MKLSEENVKKIELERGQNEYDAVAQYVKRYWKHVSYDNVVLSISVSVNDENYHRFNTIASINDSGDVEFLYDWWEGEKFIKLYGIKAISDLKISGGLFDE